MNKVEQNYQRGRINLLIMVVLTVVDIILIFVEAERSFPFSAFIPQVGAVASVDLMELNEYLLGGIYAAIAIVFIGAYLLCYFLSKKHFGWMIAALCLFSIDALVFLYCIFSIGFETADLIDIAFHAWVLYYLIIGVVSGGKMRKQPVDMIEPTLPMEE